MIQRRMIAVLVTICALSLPLQDAARANMAPPLEEFRLGLAVEKTKDGPRITKIEKSSAAEKAGLKTGDLILSVDRRYAKKLSQADLKSLTEDVHVWPVELIVVRDGEEVMDFRLES